MMNSMSFLNRTGFRSPLHLFLSIRRAQSIFRLHQRHVQEMKLTDIPLHDGTSIEDLWEGRDVGSGASTDSDDGEDEELYRQAARETYKNIRDALFERFQNITADDNDGAWTPVLAPREETETLQLYTSRQDMEDIGFCYWRVRGRVELPGFNLYQLLSDYWHRTRLSWDSQMANVKVIEQFDDCKIRVVQTLRKDASMRMRSAGGTLGLEWKRYSPKRRTWMVLFHSLLQHRHVTPGPPITCRGMGETWSAAFICDNPDDASACTLDIVSKVWAPVPSCSRILGNVRKRDEESLRQRVHLYERIQRSWYKHFPPGLEYGVDIDKSDGSGDK